MKPSFLNYNLDDRLVRKLIQIKPPVVYLAGPMEATTDGGKGWRLEYKETLEREGFSCINPLELEDAIAQDRGIDMTGMWDLKAVEPDKFRYYMREVIEVDLQAVDASDLLVVKYSGQKSAGVIHEVGHAWEHSIPCYLITELEPKDILSWFLACFDMVVPDLETLLPIIKKEFK